MVDLPFFAQGGTGLTFDPSAQNQQSNPTEDQGWSDLLSSEEADGNPLDVFQTFNCLYTLACLSPDQQNSGTMDKSSLTNIVCRSQGDWKEDRANKRVQTDFGTFDYFIDDVIIASIPAASEKTGNSFATKISFKVTEPYSMGLFLMALQQGAQQAGYGLNFKEASYMFMIEFIGYIDGKPAGAEPGDQLTRYIPIKFINIKFQVTGTGSVYECEAIPYNEAAFRDNIVKVTTDIKITGKTVGEILAEGPSSLVNQLWQKYNNDQKIENGDLYVILFPESWDQELGSENEISKSLLYEDLDANGTVPFKDMKDIFVEGKEIFSSSAFQIDEKRNWNFTQEVTIPDVITEVILRSHYVTDQITGSTFNTDDNGMVKWFRIETKIIDGDQSSQLGRQARTYYYRVLPYKVHIHKFLPPGVKPPGYANLTQNVARVYNYIYTGLNTEVLKVDINFDMAFFTPLPGDYTENVGQDNWNQGGILAGGQDTVYNFPQTAEGAGISQTPDFTNLMNQFGGSLYTSGSLSSQETQRTLTSSASTESTGEGQDALSVSQHTGLRQFQYKAAGGSGSDNSKTSQIRTYQALLTNDADMVQLNLEIMGDPYYIPSSGMGNQKVDRESINLLSDGSMNYQESEVDIILNFRTPVDLDPQTGLYKFVKTIDIWSGLYQVIEVESRFNQNKFTQKIRANRLRTQVGGTDDKYPALVEESSKGEAQPGGLGGGGGDTGGGGGDTGGGGGGDTGGGGEPVLVDQYTS